MLVGCSKPSTDKDATLVSIATSGTVVTSYIVGDSFIKPKIVATYSNKTTKDVTSSTTFSGYNMSEPETYTVIASYTEKEITKTCNFAITVEESGGQRDYGYDYYDRYYGNLTWTDGEDLKEKLHDIISTDYTSLKYASNWDINKKADRALDDQEMVDVVYGNDNEPIDATYNGSRGWQREHAFAASLMTGFTSGDAVTSNQGRATDFHNLLASNNSGNTSRGNKNFGMADPNDDGIETDSQGYQDRGSYKFDTYNFEPSDYDKGRLARAVFYMGVRYTEEETQDITTKLTYNAEDAAKYGQATTTVHITATYKPLEIVEEYVPYSKVTYTNYYYAETPEIQALVNQYGAGPEGYARYSYDNCRFAIGNLSTLLSWNSFSVDLEEVQHNETVYSYSYDGKIQGNRNPFIDYPGLVEYVYGSKKNESGDLRYIKPSYLSLHLNEEGINHYAIKTANREFGVGDTFDKDCYTLVGIKSDFSEVPIDFQNTNEPYTFVAADVGTKTLEINTPKNTIKISVSVSEHSENEFSYVYQVEGSGKFNKNFASGSEVTLGDITWVVSWSNSEAAPVSNSSTYGYQFGTGAKPCQTFTLQSKNSLSNVNKVYLKGTCAANNSMNYSMKVGSTTVASGTYTRGSTAPDMMGGELSTPASGKVTITLSNLAAAVYIHTIYLNQVS